jgi:beta-glucanase (GH16 family)
MAKAGHEDASIPDLTAFHVYALEREPGVIRWLIDDRVVFSKTAADLPWLDSTFNEPMNIRLNLQVGGSMPAWYGLNVDASSVLPADFVVDYVRVLTR